MLPSFETLELEIEDKVATVTLNRPEKSNAMNTSMWADIHKCFNWLDSELSVRAVILAGAGKNFCSGLDLDMFQNLHQGSSDPARVAESVRQSILKLQSNLTSIETCRKPVLAAVQRACIGGGVDMISCCDIRYACQDTYFSIREIDIGMTADVGTLQRLPKLIPDGVARELAYTGRKMNGGEAKEVGFVNFVFEDYTALLSGVKDIAKEIAAKSPISIRGTKEMLLYTRDHSVQDGLNYIATWNAGMLSQQDLIAGITAQAERKVANYED